MEKLSEYVKSTERMSDISKNRLVRKLEIVEWEMDEAIRLMKLSLIDLNKDSHLYKAISGFLERNDDMD